MTDPIQLISSLPPQFADDCLRFTRFTFAWGGWFIILAFIAAIVQTVSAVVSMFQKTDPNADVAEAGSATALLEALKGVLIALASLPAWVAIFLAGLALLWMSSEAPKRCAAQEAPKREAPKLPADAQRDPQQPAENPSAH